MGKAKIYIRPIVGAHQTYTLPYIDPESGGLCVCCRVRETTRSWGLGMELALVEFSPRSLGKMNPI